MKFIKKAMISEVVIEEEINNTLYQGIAYRCPTCHTDVLPNQSKCECGQRLKVKEFIY